MVYDVFQQELPQEKKREKEKRQKEHIDMRRVYDME
jgi:hypothetical protein